MFPDNKENEQKNEVNQPRLNMYLKNSSVAPASQRGQPARDKANVTHQYGQRRELPTAPQGSINTERRNEIDGLIERAKKIGFIKYNKEYKNDKEYVIQYGCSLYEYLFIQYDNIRGTDTTRDGKVNEFYSKYSVYKEEVFGNGELSDQQVRDILNGCKEILKALESAFTTLEDKLRGLYSKIKEVDKDEGLHEKVGTCPEKFDSLKSLQNNADKFIENIGNWYYEKATEPSTEANYDISMKASSVANAVLDLQRRGLLVGHNEIETMKALNEFENTVINDKIQAYVNLRNNPQPSAPVGSAPAEAVSSPSGDSQNPVAVSSESSQPPINQSVNVNAGGSLSLKTLTDELRNLYSEFNEKVPWAKAEMGECGNRQQLLEQIKKLWRVIGDNCVKGEKALTHLARCEGCLQLYEAFMKEGKSGKSSDGKHDYLSDALDHIKKAIKSINYDEKDKTLFSFQDLKARLESLYGDYSLDIKMGEWGNWKDLVKQIEKLLKVIRNKGSESRFILDLLEECDKRLANYKKIPAPKGEDPSVQARIELCMALDNIEDAIKWVSRTKDDKSNKGNGKFSEPVDSVVSKIGKTIRKVPGKVTEFIDKRRNKKQLSPEEIEKELGEKGNGYLSKRVEEFEQQISVICRNFEKQNVNLESVVDNTGTRGGVCSSIINILKNSSISEKLADAEGVRTKLSEYVDNVDNKNLTNDEVIPTIAGVLDELEKLSKGEDERIKEIREISVERILALIKRFREVSVISIPFDTMDYTQNDRNVLKELSVFIEKTLFTNALKELKAAAKNAKITEEKVQARLNKIKNDKDFDKCSLNEIKNYFDEILNLIGRMILSIGRRQKEKGRKNKGVVGKAVSAVKKAGGKALDKVGDSSVGRAGFRVGRKAGKLLDKGLTKLGFQSENAVNEKDDRKLEKCFENAGKYFVKAEKSSGKFGADEEGKVNACFTTTDLIRRFKPLEKYAAYKMWYTNLKKALKSTKHTVGPILHKRTKEKTLLGKLIASLHDMKNANNITIACNGFMLGAPNDKDNTPVLTEIKKNCFKVIASRCASGINSKAFDTLVERLLTTAQGSEPPIFTMQEYGVVSSYFNAKWDDKSANKESPAQQAQQGQQEETPTIPAKEKPPIPTKALPQEPESSTLLSSQYKPVSQSAHSAGKDSVNLGGYIPLGGTKNKP